MRTVLVVALASCMAWAVGEYVAIDFKGLTVDLPSPRNNPSYFELSRDNGNIASAWCYINGAGAYAGDQYDTPSSPPNWWFLMGIKYFVWSQGWPDNIYQGFGLACWKIASGIPGDLIWPEDGMPAYNPNTGGNWIFFGGTNPYVDHRLVNLSNYAPQGFLVGIEFMYTYPEEDAFGVDNTGVGPYDWAYVGGTWQAAPYGKGSARAIVAHGPPMNVESSTLGSIRAFYR